MYGGCLSVLHCILSVWSFDVWVGYGTMLCVVKNNEIVTFALQVEPGLDFEDGVCTKITCTIFFSLKSKPYFSFLF